MDFLYTERPGQPDSAMRAALSILSRPIVHKLNPLGFSDEMVASIAAWNQHKRARAA